MNISIIKLFGKISVNTLLYSNKDVLDFTTIIGILFTMINYQRSYKKYPVASLEVVNLVPEFNHYGQPDCRLPIWFCWLLYFLLFWLLNIASRLGDGCAGSRSVEGFEFKLSFS